MNGASASHVGQIRKVNQDRAMFTESLGAVADGMGGHLGGEQAASIVISELLEVKGLISQAELLEVVRTANQKVHDEGAKPELRGMGTTLVAASLDPGQNLMSIVNVGDSRAYRLRNSQFEQLTLDHSLVEELVREGRLSAEEARSHPQRNIVTRAMGLSDAVEIDTFDFIPELGDRFLLCSDGLVNEVPVREIAESLASIESPTEAAEQLVATAVEEGGRDNVSVVVIDLVDDDVETPSRPSGVVVVEPSFTEPTPTEPVAAIRFVDPPESSSRRRIKGSTVGIVLGVLAVIAAAVLVLSDYGENGYYAAELDGQVVIYRARSGVGPWSDPEVVEVTEIETDQLADADALRLQQETVWISLAEARDYVDGFKVVEPDGY